MNFDKDLDRKTRVQIWEAGIDLGVSWREFGHLRQIQQQKERAGTPGSPMVIELMLADIWGQAREELLVAMGYRIAPTVSDGPVLVPSDAFGVRPDFDDAFNNDAINASGWKYERVRIFTQSDFGALTNEAATFLTIDDVQSLVATAKSPGPKSAGPIIEQLYKKMKMNGDLKSCTTKKAIYNKMRPILSKDGVNFPNGRGLAYSSFSRHLKQITPK